MRHPGSNPAAHAGQMPTHDMALIPQAACRCECANRHSTTLETTLERDVNMTNIFNSLNSVIWLLVLVLVIAVVVVVVRAALATRAGPPSPSEPPIVHQQPVVQQPVEISGLAPGWYPDQNDPHSMRYFDGRVWSTQPRN